MKLSLHIRTDDQLVPAGKIGRTTLGCNLLGIVSTLILEGPSEQFAAVGTRAYYGQLWFSKSQMTQLRIILSEGNTGLYALMAPSLAASLSIK